MAYCSYYEEIIFVEGKCEYIESKGSIEFKRVEHNVKNELNGLNAVVKHQLADKAKALGCNAVINFKYGQAQSKSFKSIFLMADEIDWYGSGEAVVISQEKKEEILEKIKRY